MYETIFFILHFCFCAYELSNYTSIIWEKIRPESTGTRVMVHKNILEKNPAIKIRTKDQDQSGLRNYLMPKQTISKKDKELSLRMEFLYSSNIGGQVERKGCRHCKPDTRK
jgi:hypothetical protein